MTRACAYLRAAARGDDSSRSKRTGERANGNFQIQKQMMLSDRLGWDNIGVNDCGDKPFDPQSEAVRQAFSAVSGVGARYH
jgi:hypothetical protein